MKLFQCQSCHQVLYFENMACMHCGHALGYLPDIGELSAVEADGSVWMALANPARRYRFCANWEQMACNWMIEAQAGSDYCLACQHNRTIPDLSSHDNRINWHKIEAAKRRLFYSLLKLGLPMPTPGDGDAEPLVFDFLATPADGSPMLTGHDDGIITIALKEADDATREAARASMGELYRTLLGHFRHEVGHYYWDRLVRDGGELTNFRALFGDERMDYGQSLSRHHTQGPPGDWQKRYVSAYATMHPWEDWAETWAHYMHMIDTLEMAGAFGITIDPAMSNNPDLAMAIGADLDPHRHEDMDRLVHAWLPLTYAVNCLNRSMGQPDLYPFVLPAPVVEKMRYIHRLIHRARRMR